MLSQWKWNVAADTSSIKDWSCWVIFIFCQPQSCWEVNDYFSTSSIPEIFVHVPYLAVVILAATSGYSFSLSFEVVGTFPGKWELSLCSFNERLICLLVSSIPNPYKKCRIKMAKHPSGMMGLHKDLAVPPVTWARLLWVITTVVRLPIMSSSSLVPLFPPPSPPAWRLSCFSTQVRAQLDAVMSNSFGFGGTNVSLLFSRVWCRGVAFEGCVECCIS